MKDLIEAAKSMTTADLEKLIEQLGVLRASREPIVPIECEFGKVVQSILAPAYRTDPDTLGAVLGLRHPGFGWLWFVFPHHDRDNLIQIWTVQQNIDSGLPPPNKIN